MDYPGYEIEDFSRFNHGDNMKNGFLKLSWENINSALVYGLLSLAGYLLKMGTIWGHDWHTLVDFFVLGVLACLVKNLLTTSDGNFAGIVPVIPDKK